MASHFCFIQFEEWENSQETLEGDLSLILNANRPNESLGNGNLYSATYEICTYLGESPLQRFEWFGTVLKFWRGSLDTLRVNRVLAGKSGCTAMHLETDYFLRILEKTHLALTVPVKPVKMYYLYSTRYCKTRHDKMRIFKLLKFKSYETKERRLCSSERSGRDCKGGDETDYRSAKAERKINLEALQK